METNVKNDEVNAISEQKEMEIKADKELEETLAPINNLSNAIEETIELGDIDFKNISEEDEKGFNSKFLEIKKALSIMNLSNKILSEREGRNNVIYIWRDLYLNEDNYNEAIANAKEIEEFKFVDLGFIIDGKYDEVFEEIDMNVQVVKSMLNSYNSISSVDRRIVFVCLVSLLSKLTEASLGEEDNSIIKDAIANIVKSLEKDGVYPTHEHMNLIGLKAFYLFKIDNIVFINGRDTTTDLSEEQKNMVDYPLIVGGSTLVFNNMLENNIKSLVENVESCVHEFTMGRLEGKFLVVEEETKYFDNYLEDNGFERGQFKLSSDFVGLFKDIIASYKDDSLTLASRIYMEVIGDSEGATLSREIQFTEYFYINIINRRKAN